MIKKIALFFSVLLSSVLISAQDYNLTDFEKRMHEIYKTSYNTEISDQEWMSYVQNFSERNYIISEGDTLWDLSVVFFGDGNVWPKVWSYNVTLTNPHMLTVGRRLQLFAGSLDEAPGVEVEADSDFNEEAEAEEEDDAQELGLPSGFKVVKTQTGEKAIIKDPELELNKVTTKTADGEVVTMEVAPRLYPGAPAIPPPVIKPKKILSKIPGTFEDSDSFDASKYDEKGISFDIRPPVRVNPLYVAHSFLYEGSAVDYPRVGRLIETEDNVLLVGQNQKVYIRSDQKLEVGERLTVMGRDYKFNRNSIKGDVIRYMGTVEINEILPDKLFRGTLIRSLSGVRGIPWVSREVIPTFEDDYKGRPSSLNFKIIGGGQDNGSRVFGQSDVVYLGGGANKGLRVGDIMGIYKRRDIRYGSVDVERSPTPIGHIKVFRTEPKVASAFVLNSEEVIIPGDETGPPTMIESVMTSSEKADFDSIESDLDFNTDANSGADSIETSLSEELSEDNIQVQ